MNINFKFFIKNLILFCFIVFLSSCAKFNEEMNREASDDFEPNIFVKEKKDTISETTSLGPKINQISIEKNKVQRRIYIDENVITDYSKIINRTFTETFPISVK